MRFVCAKIVEGLFEGKLQFVHEFGFVPKDPEITAGIVQIVSPTRLTRYEVGKIYTLSMEIEEE